MLPAMGMGAIGGIAPIGDKLMGPPPGMAMYVRPPTDIPPHFKPPMGGMGIPNLGPANVKMRVNTLIRDRQRFENMEENAAKRGMIDTLRLWVEDLGVANGQEALRIVSTFFVI